MTIPSITLLDESLTIPQSSVPSVLSNLQPTKKPAPRTPSSPKSPTEPPPRTHSSCSRSPSSPSASTKSMKTHTKATTTPSPSASRASGPSKSSSTRKPTTTTTTSGYTRVRNGSRSCTPRVPSLSSSLLCCSRCGPSCSDRVCGTSAWACSDSLVYFSPWRSSALFCSSSRFSQRPRVSGSILISSKMWASSTRSVLCGLGKRYVAFLPFSIRSNSNPNTIFHPFVSSPAFHIFPQIDK